MKIAKVSFLKSSIDESTVAYCSVLYVNRLAQDTLVSSFLDKFVGEPLGSAGLGSVEDGHWSFHESSRVNCRFTR